MASIPLQLVEYILGDAMVFSVGRPTESGAGMSPASIRNWIGIYLLVLTGSLAGVLLLAGNMMPLEESDITASFEIMIPFLLGELAVVFRFYVHPRSRASQISIPAWVVKGPPIIVTVLLVVGFGVELGGGLTQSRIAPSPERFKALLTFCVALLNVTTIYVMTKYFEQGKRDAKAKLP